MICYVEKMNKMIPANKRTMAIIPGASGTSEANEMESVYAEAWAENIWADMLAQLYRAIGRFSSEIQALQEPG